MMGLPTNEDGTCRPFTPEEVVAMGIEIIGIKDGASPVHVRALNSSTIRVMYRCLAPAFDNGDFLAYMLGGSNWTGDGFLSRLLPQTYPLLPEFACTKLEDAHGYPIARFAGGQYLGKSPLGAIPAYAKMTCEFTFEHVPFALLPDGLTSSELFRYVQTLPSTTEANYLTLPSSVLRYFRDPEEPGFDPTRRPNNVSIPHSIGFPVVTQTIRRKWIRVPFGAWQPGAPLYNRVVGDPTNNQRPYIGTVNDRNFMGYDRWTLLYLGIDEELDRDPIGEGYCWNLTHKWMFDPQTHLRKYFFETDAKTGVGNGNGYYFVGTSQFWPANSIAALPDDTTYLCERNHMNLFNTAEVS